LKANFGKEKGRNYLKLFLLIIIMQTLITIVTNSIQQIIYDLPSIIEYKSDDKTDQTNVDNVRNSSIKQGIGISSSLLIVPFLVSITQDLGLNTITWQEITKSL
jgi:hypothetical protein